LSNEQISGLGLKEFGSNVRISPTARFHNPQNISIGNNVRIDDFAVLSGNIEIGSFVHISIHASIISPRAEVLIADYATLSFYSCVTSANDDYSGKFLMNPMVASKFTNVHDANVYLAKHVAIGAFSLVLPGVTLNEGCVIGAHSLVKHSIPPWEIFGGVPAKKIANRSKDILGFDLED
jgi:galactoside O-acetyltransferase